MQQYFDIIKKCPLFKGINFEEFEKVLNCVQGRQQKYQKQDVILLSGQEIKTVGLVLCGTVQVQKEDSEGKQNILTELGAGEIFGEVFACAGVENSPVTVIATSETEIMHLNYRKIITTCPLACSFHNQLIENMLMLIAQKNLMLNQKIEILSKRSTRQRILLFLDSISKKSKEIEIPFTHEELAAYLCVERSALSAELSKMQKEKLISYSGKHFKIL